MCPTERVSHAELGFDPKSEGGLGVNVSPSSKTSEVGVCGTSHNSRRGNTHRNGVSFSSAPPNQISHTRRSGYLTLASKLSHQQKWGISYTGMSGLFHTGIARVEQCVSPVAVSIGVNSIHPRFRSCCRRRREYRSDFRFDTDLPAFSRRGAGCSD